MMAGYRQADLQGNYAHAGAFHSHFNGQIPSRYLFIFVQCAGKVLRGSEGFEGFQCAQRLELGAAL